MAQILQWAACITGTIINATNGGFAAAGANFAALWVGIVVIKNLKSARSVQIGSWAFVLSCFGVIGADVVYANAHGDAFYVFLFLAPLIYGFVLDVKSLWLLFPMFTVVTVDLADSRLDLLVNGTLGDVETVPIIVYCTAYLVSSGAVTCFIIVHQRALHTARRTAAHLAEEVTVRAAAEQAAKEAARAKSDFLAMMSHEIRTPMNGIMGMAELITDASLPDDVRENARILESSARSLLVVLNDVLDFSKIEAGKLMLESRPYDLRCALTRTVDLLRPQASDKGLRLAADLCPSGDDCVVGDEVRLGQILTNLLTNAIKFTARGGLVTLRWRALAHDRHRIEVEDTGIGIEAAALERLFNPFEQADTSTTRRFGGTGLGLPITRRIVELMNGTIGVNSTVGRGSLFWFELPLAAADAISSPDRSADRAALADDRPVLVVDDNLINRRVAQALVEKLGLSVCTASSGQEALDIVRTASISVVLMDIQMPDMDGLETTRRIRSLFEADAVPIIGLSANAMDYHRREALAVGMHGYLTKPVRSTELHRELSRVLDVPRRAG